MANYNAIKEEVGALHKDWSDDAVELLAEEFYEDARESEYEDDFCMEDDYEDDYEDCCEDDEW